MKEDLDWFYQPFNGTNLYGGGNRSQNCYIKKYNNGTWYKSVVVFDALGGARKAYTVRTGFLTDPQGWKGPNSSLGMPITNEYNFAGGARQDFQGGYLMYKPGQGISVHYLPNMPGWAWGNWDNAFSYLFARAYERNGAAAVVGSAVQSAANEQFRWAGVTDNYWIQRFDGPNGRHGAILYHPNNAERNSEATNEAYYLYGEFWNKWNTVDPGSGLKGAQFYGVPTRDRYMSRDPEHWGQTTEYQLQNFMRPNGDQHYMILKNGVVEWHSYQIVSQLAGDLTGDGLADVVLVTNSGVYLYRNTGSSFVNDGRIDAWTPNDRPCLLADVLGQGRCQLISWGVDGVHCQIYDSGTNPKLGSPIRLSSWSPDPSWRVKAGDVDNNGTADLVIQTPSQLVVQRSWWSGSYDQQLHLQTWANWSSYPYQLLVGDFDPDGQADVLFSIPNDRVYYKYSTGSTFGPNIRLISWAFNATDSILTGYFTRDHRIALMRPISSGCDLLVAGSGYQGPYHWSSWSPYPAQSLVGDVNADGLDDVIAVLPDTREIMVLLNDNGDRFSGPFRWYGGSGGATPFSVRPSVEEQESKQLKCSIQSNPVVGTARFSLTLPQGEEVVIEVFDLAGRRAAMVASGQLPAGEHAFSWDSRGHPAGVYLVRFQGGGITKTQRIVLLR